MSKSVCKICGKPLTDNLSIALGIGPVCRVKKKTENVNSGNLFAPRAEYDYKIEGSIVYIEDKGGMKSVTHDIVNILADITRDQDISNKKIMYKDSDGVWDGVKANINVGVGAIVVENVEFFPLTETNFRKAKEKLLAK